jgi:hypothetical protein
MRRVSPTARHKWRTAGWRDRSTRLLAREGVM